jgi:hypothetical protein
MSVKPIAAGFLALDDACPSDHMALWIDLKKQDVLGANSETFAVKKKSSQVNCR